MLFKKMMQDIKNNKWQFISIMVMAFLGVFIYTGVGGEWAGVNRYREKYYEQTNLADGWIWGEGFTDDDIKTVKQIDGVTEAEKRCYLEVTGQDSANPTVYFYGLNENSINMPYVVEGEDVDVNSTGKVWLDANFANAKNLNVGDSYTFKLQNVSFTLKIAGLVYSSEYQYYSNDNDLWPDYNKIGFAYTSVNSLPIKEYIIDLLENGNYSDDELIKMFSENDEQAQQYKKMLNTFSRDFIIKSFEKANASEFAQAVPYTQIIFKSSVPAEELSDVIDKELSGRYAVYTTREQTSGVKMLDSEMEQHKAIGSVFPIAFMLIAVLAIITGMNRLVNNQRTQIGTLKALGFSKAKIAMHYVNYGFWTSLVGSVLGLIAGPFILPNLFYGSMKSYYSLPKWTPGWDFSFGLVALGTVAVCSLTTFLTVINLLGDCPAQTLRPKAPKTYKLSKFEKGKFWARQNFNSRWSLRDIKRSKVRTLMGIVGTISCMALLIGAFSMYDCMNDMESWMYDEIQVQQTRFVLDSTATLDDALEIAKDVNGELVMSAAIELKANGNKKTETLTCVDGSGCFNLTDAKRNIIVPDDNTFALSKKTADALGVSAGDEISWHIYTSDKWVTSKITIVNRTPMSQGIVLTRSTLEGLGYEFTPNYVDSMERFTTYDNSAVANVLTADDMHGFWSNYMSSMNLMVGVLILFALILAVVVLYNLGQLTFTEKERELATLKVVGFSTGKIRNLILTQNMLFAAVGVIFGTFFGLWLVHVVIATAGDEFDMMVKLSLPSFLISAAVTLGVSALVSLMFTKRIKRLDMVGSLKGVE